MELGEKLRRARLESGLSQRQLCGEEITRNMLSLIENGSAKPSMKTLQYLAGRLGKSVSYFLEETAVLSPNQSVMDCARQLYDSGKISEAYKALEAYQGPDPVYDREQALLLVLLRLALAEEAIRQQRHLYAAQLLEETSIETVYLAEELNRRRLLLLGSLPGQKTASQLPSIDGELLLRAEEAFSENRLSRAARLLDAMEDRNTPRWYLLRGKIYLKQKKWKPAATRLQMAEGEFPREACPLLEICYRELGDFQKAYEYACKQRK